MCIGGGQAMAVSSGGSEVPDLIGYSVAQGVAHIRLNRPEVSNALDLAAARALATTSNKPPPTRRCGPSS